jgi:hypothetical protein
MGMRAVLAAGVVVTAVLLPVEIAFDPEAAVPAPDPSACLLLGSSCLLLIGSSLTLRREEAARRLAPRQADLP